MAKRYDIQPGAVKTLSTGDMVRGKGLSPRASKGVCPCCNVPLTEHKWVRVAYTIERPDTGYQGFVGADCKRVKPDAETLACGRTLELRIACKGDPGATIGALKWTLRKQPYTWALEKDAKGRFTGNGILTVYVPGKACAIGKLPPVLAATGVEAFQQRLTAGKVRTEWMDVDSTTWRPFFSGTVYKGRKAYNV